MQANGVKIVCSSIILATILMCYSQHANALRVDLEYKKASQYGEWALANVDDYNQISRPVSLIQTNEQIALVNAGYSLSRIAADEVMIEPIIASNPVIHSQSAAKLPKEGNKNNAPSKMTFDKNHDVISQITSLFKQKMEKKFMNVFGESQEKQAHAAQTTADLASVSQEEYKDQDYMNNESFAAQDDDDDDISTYQVRDIDEQSRNENYATENEKQEMKEEAAYRRQQMSFSQSEEQKVKPPILRDLMESITRSNQKFSGMFEKNAESLVQLDENIVQSQQEQIDSGQGSYVETLNQLGMEMTLDEADRYTIELENLLNAQYIGSLYLGSPKLQYAELSFDTGSNWLTVTSSLGAKRGEKKGAYDLKNTNSGYAVSKEIVNEKYGSTDLSGQIWRDRVCLGGAVDAPCVDDFPFIAIKEQKGLMQQMDGILGLGPQLFTVNPEDKKLVIDVKKNPDSSSLMQFLKEQRLLNETIASFCLSEETKRSYVTFGERNSSQIKGGSKKMVSFKQINEEWWTIDVERFLYDYEMPKFEGSTDIAQAVIDTGTSLMGVPPDHHQYIVAMWKQTFGKAISCDQVVCFGKLTRKQQDCSEFTERMQPVQIMFDSETVFEIKPEGYTFIQENFCIFGIMEFAQSVQKFEDSKEAISLKRVKHEKVQKKGAYLLGGVFLRNFYTVFNWDKKVIEFGLNIDAQSQASIKSAEKAFKSKGKENESLQNIKIEQKTDKDKEKEKDTEGESGTSSKVSSSSKSEKQQSILDKINKSVKEIKNDIKKETIEMSKKEDKIENLKNTLQSLNENKKELTKDHPPKMVVHDDKIDEKLSIKPKEYSGEFHISTVDEAKSIIAQESQEKLQRKLQKINNEEKLNRKLQKMEHEEKIQTKNAHQQEINRQKREHDQKIQRKLEKIEHEEKIQRKLEKIVQDEKIQRKLGSIEHGVIRPKSHESSFDSKLQPFDEPLTKAQGLSSLPIKQMQRHKIAEKLSEQNHMDALELKNDKNIPQPIRVIEINPALKEKEREIIQDKKILKQIDAYPDSVHDFKASARLLEPISKEIIIDSPKSKNDHYDSYQKNNILHELDKNEQNQMSHKQAQLMNQFDTNTRSVNSRLMNSNNQDLDEISSRDVKSIQKVEPIGKLLNQQKTKKMLEESLSSNAGQEQDREPSITRKTIMTPIQQQNAQEFRRLNEGNIDNERFTKYILPEGSRDKGNFMQSINNNIPVKALDEKVQDKMKQIMKIKVANKLASTFPTVAQSADIIPVIVQGPTLQKQMDSSQNEFLKQSQIKILDQSYQQAQKSPQFQPNEPIERKMALKSFNTQKLEQDDQSASQQLASATIIPNMKIINGITGIQGSSKLDLLQPAQQHVQQQQSIQAQTSLSSLETKIMQKVTQKLEDKLEKRLEEKITKKLIGETPNDSISQNNTLASSKAQVNATINEDDKIESNSSIKIPSTSNNQSEIQINQTSIAQNTNHRSIQAQTRTFNNQSLVEQGNLSDKIETKLEENIESNLENKLEKKLEASLVKNLENNLLKKLESVLETKIEMSLLKKFEDSNQPEHQNQTSLFANAKNTKEPEDSNSTSLYKNTQETPSNATAPGAKNLNSSAALSADASVLNVTSSGTPSKAAALSPSSIGMVSSVKSAAQKNSSQMGDTQKQGETASKQVGQLNASTRNELASKDDPTNKIESGEQSKAAPVRLATNKAELSEKTLIPENQIQPGKKA